MISLLLAAAVAFSAEDADVAYETARTLVEECTPRDAGTVRGRLAAYKILDLVSAAGADAKVDRFEADTPRGRRTFHNVYSEFAAGSKSDEWVVVLSHFDTKPGVDCPGANDGASTTGLLTGLANSIMRERKLRGNLMLVWTDGEECMDFYAPNDGFWGAKRVVAELARRGMKVKAAIVVDMLGDRDLEIMIPANTSRALANIALYAAKKAGEDGLVVKTDDLVKDDHVPFIEAGIKALCLIDFKFGSSPGANDYWHTPADTMDKISKRSLHRSGKILAEMLNVLFTKKSKPQGEKKISN